MFNDIYRGKKVLVTGHCGAKGSLLTAWLIRLGAKVYGISHPPGTTPNHYELLNLHDFMAGDILADISLVDEITSISPDLIIHLAARAIIAKTFEEPELSFKYTVGGAVHILELCRQCSSVKGIVIATSDKIYEDKEWVYGYRETDEMGGVTPYDASKCCVEHVIRCYRESFGVNIATARAGNILMGGDWSFGRLLPDIARATAKGKRVMIHTPNATRPFQHALDALSGYLTLGQAILEGRDVRGAYNFGPDSDPMTVLDIIKTAKIYWPKIMWEVDNKPVHDHMIYLLKLDNSKSKKELGWRPVWDMEQAVGQSILWYRGYYEEKEVMTNLDIDEYEADYAKL